MRFTGFPFELRTFYDHPGHGLGTGSATAVFAMTIRADTRLSAYREPNFAGITSPSDPVHLMSYTSPPHAVVPLPRPEFCRNNIRQRSRSSHDVKRTKNRVE